MMSAEKHVFLSYVKEDVERVIDIQSALEAAGINVWRDKDQLWPGVDWMIEIRKAIRSGSLAFVACFSENSAKREKSYQNEELIVATEEFRLRPPGSQWLFPVRFDDVEVPEFDLGAGRTLGSVQFTDMFGSRAIVEFSRLTAALSRIMNPTATAGTTAPLAMQNPGDNVTRTIKTLLRDPNGDIALEELVTDIATAVRDDLNDEQTFPTGFTDGNQSGQTWVSQVSKTLDNYDRVVAPLAEIFMLAGQYGLPTHEAIWARAMSILASATDKPSGSTLLLHLRGYPMVHLMYVTALAGISRKNFGSIRAVAIDTTIRTINDKVPAVVYTNVSNVEGDMRWLYSAVEYARKDNREITEEFAEQCRTGAIGTLYTPVSDRLAAVLKDRFESMFPSTQEYEEQLDMAEAFLDTLSADQNNQKKRYIGSWVGAGRYTWRYRHGGNAPEAEMQDQLKAQGRSWPPLTAGLFDGSPDRAQAALDSVAEVVTRARSRW